jgi:hypothetical protein
MTAHFPWRWNHIEGVMVRVLVSSAVDCVLEPWSVQTKDYQIGIVYFSAHSMMEKEQRLVGSESE